MMKPAPRRRGLKFGHFSDLKVSADFKAGAIVTESHCGIIILCLEDHEAVDPHVVLADDTLDRFLLLGHETARFVERVPLHPIPALRELPDVGGPFVTERLPAVFVEFLIARHPTADDHKIGVHGFHVSVVSESY